MRISLPLALIICAASITAQAAAPGLLGDWREPGGSVIRIAPCGSGLCLTLVAISPTAPARVDHHNPDPALQKRPLCGLVIGHDFHASNANHADSGTLYDPKTGKTYRGEMSATGDMLSLRGYIGIRAFGRTENWTRTSAPPPCPVS
jgi:uncharacterized protein (DUF2147 family)